MCAIPAHGEDGDFLRNLPLGREQEISNHAGMHKTKRSCGSIPLAYYRHIAFGPVEWEELRQASKVYDLSPHRLAALICRNWLKKPTELMLLPEHVVVPGHDYRKGNPSKVA